MTTLIIVRHGQSMANLEDKFAGQTYNPPLSPLGHEQAEHTAEYIVSNYKVDAIYSSDLNRAFQTAEHIAGKLGAEIITEPGMREIYAGKWEGMKFDDIDSEYEEEFKLWKTNIGITGCLGGEKVSELADRVLSAITRIAEDNDGKAVVVATHATPIRALETLWRKMSIVNMKNIPWVSNASVTVAEYKDGEFALISVGEDKHLGAMRTALPENV